MKKILSFLTLFVLVLPFSSAFAYSGGLLNGKQVQNTATLTEINPGTWVTDNNVSTFLNMPYRVGHAYKYAYYNFNNPVLIDSYYLDVVNSSEVVDYKLSFYDVNNNLISDHTSLVDNVKTSIIVPDVPVYKVVIEKTNLSYVSKLAEFDVFGTNVYPPVTNLVETHTFDSVNLSWINPEGSTGTIIKQDEVQITDLDSGKSSYEISGLSPETTYTFDVIAKYQDGQSAAVSKTITTKSKEKAGDIKDLKASAKHNRVDLSWILPSSDNLQHVNIYRDVATETALIDRVLGTTKVSAASTKIFETNGTYFNDLTVQPETTYEYTLTTTSTDGLESDGVTTKVTTLVEPLTKFDEVNLEKNDNGDYTYSWSQPTTGQVKIFIDGQFYKTVDADTGQITIPESDMKFDAVGTAKIKMVPINVSGKEGEPFVPKSETFGSVKIPFSAGDLLNTGTGLLMLVGGFVLLGLAFIVVPLLRNLIINSFQGGKGDSVVGDRRTVANEGVAHTERSGTTAKEPRGRALRVERVSAREPRETHFKAPRERVTREVRTSKKESREPRIREREGNK